MDIPLRRVSQKTTLQQKKDLRRRLEVFLSGKPFNPENIKAFQQELNKNGCDESSSRARHVYSVSQQLTNEISLNKK